MVYVVWVNYWKPTVLSVPGMVVSKILKGSVVKPTGLWIIKEQVVDLETEAIARIRFFFLNKKQWNIERRRTFIYSENVYGGLKEWALCKVLEEWEIEKYLFNCVKNFYEH